MLSFTRRRLALLLLCVVLAVSAFALTSCDKGGTGTTACQHTATAVTTTATCTEAGVETTTCTACKKVISTVDVPASGHDYQAGTPVETSCASSGYTPYTCSRCSDEKRGDVEFKLPHTYGADEVCTGCGKTMVHSDLADLLESMMADDRTVTFENLSLELIDVLISDGVRNDVTEGRLTVALAELVISYREGKYIVYAQGDMSMEDDGSSYLYGASVYLYGDGDYLYIKAAYQEDPVSSPETGIVRYSYDALISDIMNELLPLDNVFEGALTPMMIDVLKGALTPVMMHDTTVIEALMNWFAQCDYVPLWIELLESYDQTLADLIDTAFFSMFDKTDIAGGFRYTLDLDRYRELYGKLSTLTVSELMDDMMGAGAFDELVTFIKTLGAKSVRAAVTDLLAVLAEQGIPTDLVFDTINSAMVDGLGDVLGISADFDIRDLLNDPEIGDVILGDLFINYVFSEMVETEVPTFGEFIDAMAEMIGEMNVIDQFPPEAKKFFDGITSTLFDEANVNVSFTTDADGNYTGSSVHLNVSLVGPESGDYDDRGVLIDGSYYIINAAIDITETLTAEIPADAPSIIEHYNEYHASILDALNGNSAINDGVVLEERYYSGDTKATAYVKKIDGQLCLVIALSDNASFADGSTEVVYAYSDIPGFAISEDCTDALLISCKLPEELEFKYSHEYSSNTGWFNDVTFYINVETGAVSEDSFHDHSAEYTGELPVGIYLTRDEAPCGAAYGKYYECSCGSVVRHSNTKNHETIHVDTLLNGSVTCEDGVLIKWICTACDQVVSIHIATDSHSGTETIKEIQTVHGTLLIYHVECACGMLANINIGYYDYETGVGADGCELAYNVSSYEKITDTDGKLLYETHRLECDYSDCDVYVIVKTYPAETVVVDGIPSYIVRSTYTFYAGGEQVYEVNTSTVKY